MLKLRYAVLVRDADEELIELCFAQLYFEYYMGRIMLDDPLIFLLGSLIYKLKYTKQKVADMALGLLPITFAKKYTKG